jgi:hypothetical protein
MLCGSCICSSTINISFLPCTSLFSWRNAVFWYLISCLLSRSYCPLHFSTEIQVFLISGMSLFHPLPAKPTSLTNSEHSHVTVSLQSIRSFAHLHWNFLCFGWQLVHLSWNENHVSGSSDNSLLLCLTANNISHWFFWHLTGTFVLPLNVLNGI